MSLNFDIFLALSGWVPAGPITFAEIGGHVDDCAKTDGRGENVNWVCDSFSKRMEKVESAGEPGLVIERWRQWRITRFRSICLS
jgi:hypothetical protein